MVEKHDFVELRWMKPKFYKSVSFTCLEISAPFGVGTTTTSNNNKNKQADVGFHELGLGIFGVYSWGRGPSRAP